MLENNLLSKHNFLQAILIGSCCLLLSGLSGCAAIAQPLKQEAANTIAKDIDSAASGVSYPSAVPLDQNIVNNPPQVDLSRYQSVQ
jgi:hypothetical protein